MTLTDFLRTTNLEKSLLIGYYGGGNYGDELLLEVLVNLLARKGVREATVTYQRPETYKAMHHDFGYRLINIHHRLATFGGVLKNKNILIGGGGLWGVDMNTNTFLLSLMLLVSRWFLFKNVYLLGVGYYNSTTKQGRLAAWFAGKAANHIIARDPETLQNFKAITPHVSLDSDIAWHAESLDLRAYEPDLALLNQRMPIGGKTLMVALRRPQSRRQKYDFQRFNKLISQLITMNPERPIILLMLESESKDPELYEQARMWRRKHHHLRLLEAPYNPLTLFLFVKTHRKRLAIVAPQLHLIMTAHIHGVAFMPIAYDNKVRALLDHIGLPVNQQLPLPRVTESRLQAFADNFFGGSK